MIRIQSRIFKVTVSHTGNSSGTSFVINHGFGHKDVRVEARYESDSQGYNLLADLLQSSGNFFGHSLITQTEENCTVRLFRWDSGSGTTTKDVDIIISESIS